MITTRVPRFPQIKVVLNVRTDRPSPSLIKPRLSLVTSLFFRCSAMQIQANVQTAKLTSSLFQPPISPALSHGDDDIEIESVVGLAEAQDEEQAEQTRSWQAPVEPGKLCQAENRSRLRVSKHVPCLKPPKRWLMAGWKEMAVFWPKSWQPFMVSTVCETPPWTPYVYLYLYLTNTSSSH